MRLLAEILTGIAIAVFFFRLGWVISHWVGYFIMQAILDGEGLDVHDMLHKYKPRISGIGWSRGGVMVKIVRKTPEREDPQPYNQSNKEES
jgi:hypothetical protein